ncbi:hypothetical protein AB4043_00680, partial [Terriglobus sp. YAF25]
GGVVELSGIEQWSQHATDIVIGTDLLELFRVTLDPEHRRLSLTTSHDDLASDATELALGVVDELPLAMLAISPAKGNASERSKLAIAPFVLDSGADSTIELAKQFLESNPQIVESESSPRQGVRILQLAQLNLSPRLALRNVPATSPIQPAGMLATKRLGGILGARILSRFTVTLDFSEHKMWIRRESTGSIK